MITPSFGLTATERVLPKMALDFTTASLDNRITFTRALDTATRVNSGGFIEVVNADIPRFDFDPVTLACRGLLVEETRSNLVLQSQSFGNAVWTPTNGSVTINNAVSPDGTQNAATFKATSPAGRLAQSVTIAAGTYTLSWYIKRRTGTGQVGLTFTFDVTASNEAVTNQWKRFSITRTFASGATISPRIFLSNANDEVDIYGAQLEAGAFATSYIPTTSAALTRNADVATMTGTNFSDWFNASEGTFAYTADTLSKATFRGGLNASDGTVSNRIDIGFVSGSLGGLGRYTVASGGVSQADSGNSSTPSININTTYGLCAAYKANSFAWSFNANTVGTDSAGSVPTVSLMEIGARQADNYLNGHIRKISYWPQRLTNAEVQAFSKG